MIRIQIHREMFAYDIYHICKAFFPGVEILQEVQYKGEDAILISIEQDEYSEFSLRISRNELEQTDDRKEKKHYVNVKVYGWLSKITEKELAWGIMTGVRPTKPILNLIEEGLSDDRIALYMKEKYLVTDRKAQLGLRVAKQERRLLQQLDYENGYSLYIGIPFCPTTCSYCSFTSYPLEQWNHKVEDYLDAVCKELTFVANKSKNKKLNTIYIGGGTPTTLLPAQLDRLLTHLEQKFCCDHLKEITVEAGRPDSITREKLQVLKDHRIGRISINPQTMQQKTLDVIGRKHTVEDVRRVFMMAREMGFYNINMDLIAGLPGETAKDMQDTLEQIQTLAPDSLTVHALAMKRASKMSQEQRMKHSYDRAEEARIASTLSEMIELANAYAMQMELEPYYLYRQKNIAGNFENVGYAKVDKAGIYNILIMEEKQSIVAVGAGASSKFALPKEQVVADPKTGNPKTIIRTENVRDIEQYIRRIDEMIDRKEELLWH